MSSKETLQAVVGSIRCYMAPFVSVVGIVGNVLIFIIFYRSKRSRFTLYCMALAITDICCLISNSLLDDFLYLGLAYCTSGRYFFRISIWHAITCKVLPTLQISFYYANAFLTVFFAIDRFLLLKCPLKNNYKFGHNDVILFCLSLWTQGLLMGSPTLITYELNSFRQFETTFYSTDRTCQAYSAKGQNFVLLTESLVVFLAPALIAGIFNTLIFYQMKRIKRFRQRLISMSQDRKQEQQGHFSLLLISTVFSSLTIPVAISLLVYVFNSTDTNLLIIYIFDTLKDINYAANFTIYMVCLPTFRRNFYRLIRSRSISKKR